jgi:hypothetical protein
MEGKVEIKVEVEVEIEIEALLGYCVIKLLEADL